MSRAMVSRKMKKAMPLEFEDSFVWREFEEDFMLRTLCC